jgi:hypothetical protein
VKEIEMKHLPRRTSVILSTLLAVSALTVLAKTSPTFDIHSNVVSKAAESKKGVIMVLAERGPEAADAAMLLLAQVKQNDGYAPLLMVADKEKLSGYMTTLALPKASLPAVIFFNKSAKEMSRVVASESADIKHVAHVN